MSHKRCQIQTCCSVDVVPFEIWLNACAKPQMDQGHRADFFWLHKNQRVKNTVSRFMCTTISLASLKYNDFIGSLCFYSTDKETRGICAVLIMLNYFFKAAEITLNTKIKAARERERGGKTVWLFAPVFSPQHPFSVATLHRRRRRLCVRSDVLTVLWIRHEWQCGPALRTGQLSTQADVGNMRPFVTSALLISNILCISGGEGRYLTGDYHLDVTKLCKR